MRFTSILSAVKDHPSLTGPGARMENNKRMQGMTIESLKKHKALIPLFVIMGAGIAFVAGYCVRLATRTTDVSWKKEEEPYNAYKSKQFKFLNPSGVDYSKLGTEIPNYKTTKDEK